MFQVLPILIRQAGFLKSEGAQDGDFAGLKRRIVNGSKAGWLYTTTRNPSRAEFCT